MIPTVQKFKMLKSIRKQKKKIISLSFHVDIATLTCHHAFTLLIYLKAFQIENSETKKNSPKLLDSGPLPTHPLCSYCM